MHRRNIALNCRRSKALRGTETKGALRSKAQSSVSLLLFFDFLPCFRAFLRLQFLLHSSQNHKQKHLSAFCFRRQVLFVSHFPAHGHPLKSADKKYTLSSRRFWRYAVFERKISAKKEEPRLDIELSRGFVAFPRGLTDWEWYTEPNTARLYFHLLLTANWSRKQWQGITIQPGQLVTSQPHLAAQLNLSTMQVRSALKHLQTTGYITVKTGPKYSLITLENYNLITGLNRLDNRQATGKQPADTSLAATTLPSIPSEPEIPSSSSEETTTTREHALVFEEYEANIGQLAPRCKTELAQYADRLGDEVTAAVLHKCGDLGGRAGMGGPAAGPVRRGGQHSAGDGGHSGGWGRAPRLARPPPGRRDRGRASAG